MESYYWLIFMAVCIVIGIITIGLITIWFAIGALAETNAESLVGETARVIERIDNINATGRVSVNGQEWMARTADGSVSEEGAIVTVDSISGVKLIVK